MADQDLDDLLHEMEFSTPRHSGFKEEQNPPPERSILINNLSLTRVNPTKLFDENTIATGKPLTNMGANMEELVPYSSGKSNQNSDSKIYRHLLLMSRMRPVGRLWARASLFALILIVE